MYSTNDKKSTTCELCGMILCGICILGLAGVMTYNWIYTMIAVISFTNNDVEAVCPQSELWWWALFIGIIWPFLLSNNAKKTANEKKGDEMPFLQVFIWMCMLTAFITWAWDQLWGIPGFANDTCAMDNWGTYNSTEGADNDGHKLFTAVEWWMYLYMVIDGLLILGICVIGGVLVVGGLCEKNMTTQTSTTQATPSTPFTPATPESNDEISVIDVTSGENL